MVPHGSPLEVALRVFAQRLGADLSSEEEPASLTTRRFPFDPRRRRMSLIVGERVIVRGAPEAVFERCVNIGYAAPAVSRMAEQGLRVVAIAVRDLGSGRDQVYL